MRHHPLIPIAASLLLLSACRSPAPGLPEGARPRFQLTAELGAEAVPVPVTPTGQSAGAATSLVVDLSDFLRTFTGYRRVLVAIADVERVVVTVTAADGTHVSRTLDRAAIASGLNSLAFQGLPAGAVTVTVTAEDAGGQVLASTTASATVVAGQTADLAVVASASASTGGGSSGGAAPAVPSPAPTAASADLALAVAIEDTPTHQAVTGAVKLVGQSGLCNVAFDAMGHAWGTESPSWHHPQPGYFSNDQLLHAFETGAIIQLAFDPHGIAFDAAGDIWITSRTGRTLTKLGPTITMVPGLPVGAPIGSPLTPVPTVPTLATCQLADAPVPRGLAIDATGQAWVSHGTHVTRVASGGAILGTYPLGGPAGALAVDRVRDVVWVTAGNRLVKLSSSGAILTTTAPFTRAPHNDYAGLAIDAAGQVWMAVPGDNAIMRFDADGATLGRIELDWPVRDVAVDAQGQIWAAAGGPEPFAAIAAARFSPQGALRQTYTTQYAGEAVFVAPNGAVWVKDTQGSVIRLKP